MLSFREIKFSVNGSDAGSWKVLLKGLQDAEMIIQCVEHE